MRTEKNNNHSQKDFFIYSKIARSCLKIQSVLLPLFLLSCCFHNCDGNPGHPVAATTVETPNDAPNVDTPSTNGQTNSDVCITNDGTIDPTCNSSASTATIDIDAANKASGEIIKSQERSDANGKDKINNEDDTDRTSEYIVPPNCKIVMAPSTITDGGWGVFSLVNISRGLQIIEGDVVVQLNDLNMSNADHTITVLQDYLWNAEETGGYYEGITVTSVAPGIGMLANGSPSKHQHNVLPFVPTVDDGGLIRTDSPGAGAITQYHNYTFFASKQIMAGSEIFVNYGPIWFAKRQDRINEQEAINNPSNIQPTTMTRGRDIQWLKQNGRCLDNLKPGKSKQPNAGRGVFAKRYIPENGVVAPVPVLVIGNRTLMDITRIVTDDRVIQSKQLLLNYCYGHPKSSLLFYPYGPMINLINHGGGKHANVKLQWSKSKVLHPSGQAWLDDKISIDELKLKNKSGLLLELVATRPIRTGDEILLDYGLDWINAWVKHVTRWTPVPDAESYAPGYVQDDVIQSLRTVSELENHPYPENVITSCFYRYSDNQKKAEAIDNSNKSGKQNEVTTFAWNMTRGIFELTNLRPCTILQRINPPPNNKKKGALFTVRIRNRYGLPASERIPDGSVHIVTNVPRYAIRLTDRIYTTDQHLINAFRKEIGFPDDIFPQQWKDLV